MAGRLPVIPMKGLAGKAGTPGEVGSTGSLIGAAVGTAAGIPLGPAGEIVLGLVGNLIGKAFDWGFRKKAKPAEPPPPAPIFKGSVAPYKAAGGSLSDPGGGVKAPIGENIRLGAAKNLQSRLFG